MSKLNKFSLLLKLLMNYHMKRENNCQKNYSIKLYMASEIFGFTWKNNCHKNVYDTLLDDYKIINQVEKLLQALLSTKQC